MATRAKLWSPDPRLGVTPKVPPPKFGPPEFVDVEQRSDEWYELRRGIPTASKFGCLMATPGKTRENYLYQLAGEVCTGELAETYRNTAMERGIAMEPAARDWYGRTRLATLEQIGFARRKLPSGRYVGGSPDSFVDDDGILEIKTMRPDLLIPLAHARVAGLGEYRAQVQGNLWLTGCNWCDLVFFYAGRLRSIGLVFRIERDEHYIRQLSDAVEVFDFDLHKVVEWIGRALP